MLHVLDKLAFPNAVLPCHSPQLPRQWRLPLVAINNGCLAELSSTELNNADRTLSELLLLLRNTALPENTTAAATG
jgi:hypothetical protein